MERLKLIIAWEGYVTSAVALPVAILMVSKGIAWPMGYVVGVTSMCLFAMSHIALSRLGAKRP